MEEQNFSTLIEFINAMEVREDDEEFKNPVDLMFDALAVSYTHLVAFDLEKLKAFDPKGVAEFRKEWNLPDKKPVKKKSRGMER